MTKVGDKLHSYDSWRRDRDWSEDKITGETTKSWLCGTRKINKATMLERQGNYSPTRWYTKQGKADYIWLDANAQNIGNAVASCKDVPLLRTIAGNVGCKVVE